VNKVGDHSYYAIYQAKPVEIVDPKGKRIKDTPSIVLAA
jgi:hypothetical protein